MEGKKKNKHKPGQYFTAQYCQGLMSLWASSTAECGLNRKIDSASLLLHRQDSIWNPCIVQKKKNLNGQFADWLERFTEPSAGIPEAIWQRAKRGCWSTERPNRTPPISWSFRRAAVAARSNHFCYWSTCIICFPVCFLIPGNHILSRRHLLDGSVMSFPTLCVPLTRKGWSGGKFPALFIATELIFANWAG